MNILHVVDMISQYKAGGSAKVPYQLGQAQAKLGHKVTIYASDYEAKEQGPPLNVCLQKFHCVLNFLGGVRVTPSMVFAGFKQFDIIHLHNYRTLVNIIAASKGVPCVLQAHGNAAPIHGLTRLVHNLFWRNLVLRRTSAFIADAEMEIGQYVVEGADRSKVSLIPVGIDFNEFARPPARRSNPTKRVLFLGRFHPIKAPDLLAKAFKILDRDDATLVMAGVDYGYEAEFRKLVKELGIESKVEYAGACYGVDKVREYTSADVYVMPSRYEMFGLTLLEALACFPANTQVVAEDIIAIHKKNYSGDLIMIETDVGIVETTPEHPFWVGNDWCLAKDLTTNHLLWYNNAIGGGSNAKEGFKKVHSGTIEEVIKSLQDNAPKRSSGGNGIVLWPSPMASAGKYGKKDDWAKINSQGAIVNSIGMGVSSGFNRWGRNNIDSEAFRARQQLETHSLYCEHLFESYGVVERENKLFEQPYRDTTTLQRSLSGLYLLDGWDIISANVREINPIIDYKKATVLLDSGMVKGTVESGSSRQNISEAGKHYPKHKGFKPKAILQIRSRQVKNISVYNFTTKSNAYLANGFLVHNCGTPVIITDRCGVAPLLPAECGIVVSFEEKALAKAIAKALDDRMADSYRQYRIKWARQYDWANIAPKVIEVYERVLNK